MTALSRRPESGYRAPAVLGALGLLVSLVLSSVAGAVAQEARLEARPLSEAERTAVELAASYLAGDLDPWWDAFAPESAWRALGKETALAELLVRAGPPRGAYWDLRTPERMHSETLAVFDIEYGTGHQETLTVELGGKPLRIERVLSSVERRPRGFLVVGAAASPAPPVPGVPPLPWWLAGAALLPLAWLALRRRSAPGWVAAVLAVAIALGAACGDRGADAPVTELPQGAVAADAAPEEIPRLAQLIPLRRILAGVGAEDRLAEYAALPKEGPVADVGRIWKAEDLIAQNRLDQAEVMLTGLDGLADIPRAELLRARLALLRGDFDACLDAYTGAQALGPDHDRLRLEIAQIRELSGGAGEGEVELSLLGEMGSRLADVYYALAAIAYTQDRDQEASRLFQVGWELEPLSRRRIFADPLLASLAARPELFPLLELESVAEPGVESTETGTRTIDWPDGFSLSLSGRSLRASYQDRRISVTNGAALAPYGTPIESARSRDRRDDQEALSRLPALLAAVESPEDLVRLSRRRDLLVAARALAEGGRWADLVELTRSLDRAVDRVDPDLVRLRAVALHRLDRTLEARRLLIDLAGTGILDRRRKPGLLIELGELFAATEEFDYAIRFLEKARASSGGQGLRQRITQLQMQKRLAEDFEQVETPKFALRFPKVTGDQYASDLAFVLREERRRLERWIPATRERVHVDLYPVVEFLRSYSTGVDVVGLFDGRIRVPFADLHSLDPMLVSILSHELAHALISVATGDRAPHWFQEGLAQHVQMTGHPTNPMAALEEAGRRMSVPAVELILAGFAEPRFIELAYEQAAWILHFIETRFGVDGVRRLHRAFAEGADTEAALQSVFGLTLEQFDRDFWLWGTRSAPKAWKAEVRRYDQEVEVAALTGRAPAPPPTPTRPGRQSAGRWGTSRQSQRGQIVGEWYGYYRTAVRPLKQSLSQVLRGLGAGDAAALSSGCASLRTSTAKLLKDIRLLSAPDTALNDSLQKAFRQFHEAARLCQSGETSQSRAWLAAGERSLGEAAAVLARYDLEP